MDFEYFPQNGKILPIEQAVIPFSNIEYSYGFGVYENTRVSNGVIFFLKGHTDRLLESAKIIRLEHPFDEEFIKNSISELVKDFK